MFSEISGRNKRSGEGFGPLKPLLNRNPVLRTEKRPMFSTTALRGGGQAQPRLAAASAQGAPREVAS